MNLFESRIICISNNALIFKNTRTFDADTFQCKNGELFERFVPFTFSLTTFRSASLISAVAFQREFFQLCYTDLTSLWSKVDEIHRICRGIWRNSNEKLSKL